MKAFLAFPYGVTPLVLVLPSFDCPAGCFLLSLVLGFAAALARPLGADLVLGTCLVLALPLRVSPLTASLAGRLHVQVPIDIPKGVKWQCGFLLYSCNIANTRKHWFQSILSFSILPFFRSSFCALCSSQLNFGIRCNNLGFLRTGWHGKFAIRSFIKVSILPIASMNVYNNVSHGVFTYLSTYILMVNVYTYLYNNVSHVFFWSSIYSSTYIFKVQLSHVRKPADVIKVQQCRYIMYMSKYIYTFWTL